MGDPANRLITSCEIFEAGASSGSSGLQQWNAVEAFCSPEWEKSSKEKAGVRALDRGVMRKLMRTWVEPKFAGNYDRIYNGSGWCPRAFLNYYAGAPGGKHAKMTEELIVSVHKFSSAPIVVVHFGFTTDDSWTPERFPRLVLINAAPVPSAAGRSFNFNKMRAMLLSRVLVGVQLDSDQFVAPSVDAIFNRTAEEITERYPLPILPSHFLDWGPTDQGPGGQGAKLWDRFCPGGKAKTGKCKWQTSRWGHAHPTWTFWALPFLGRWLRRNYRDEWLPARHDGDMKALRVVDVTEDEDLLNVGTWEEGGTKQWCKFDIPDPTEFHTLFSNFKGKDKDKQRKCQKGMCGDIVADQNFNPDGVAKVFYTARHAVDPAATKKWVNDLEGLGRYPPILYHRHFFSDGVETLRAHPKLKCLV